MHTAALIGKNGSIDWMCYPHFNSASVFAAILDDEKGGTFKIFPQTENVTFKQFYWPDTNVLITRFLSPDGVAEIIDFMPVCKIEIKHRHQLIRKLRVVRGSMQFHIVCQPAFNYARDTHKLTIHKQNAMFQTQQLNLLLLAGVPLRMKNGAAVADVPLSQGTTIDFILMQAEEQPVEKYSIAEFDTEALLRETISYWQNWVSTSTYSGRWREMITRSALVLKLLTYKPTGAIVAAPTTSLPEAPGGERNWDYRYTWIRDSAYTLYALMRLGFTDEAAQFMRWIEARCQEMHPDGSLQIMYGIDGEHHLKEEILHHLKGYRDSRPVRIGNGAFEQLQLDIYGELLDTIYLFNKYGTPISYNLWTYISRILAYVCDHWNEADEGIWEVRGGRQRFVYSMLMCWVALDRGIRLAQKRSFPADYNRWYQVRDTIYKDIMDKGWNEEKQAFVQYIGSDSLDASSLIMPLVFFLSPTDPRMLKTLEAIDCSPNKGGLVSDSLVFRYNVNETDDGLSGEEGTFNMCSFWLIEALTRAGKHDRTKLDEARYLFNKMLSYSNHLGLYSEELGPCGEALGNFPQAFTHLSLISAAYNLNKALGE